MTELSFSKRKSDHRVKDIYRNHGATKSEVSFDVKELTVLKLSDWPTDYSAQDIFLYKMTVLWLVGFILAVLWLTRLTFTLLFAVPAFVCLANETSTETCGSHVFTQAAKDEINMAGTFIESGSSLAITLLIFCWGKFNVVNFFLAAPRLAVFWFWLGLFCVQIITIVNMDFLPSQLNLQFLGVSLLLEFTTLIFLCLALKFIEKSTVKAWIRRTVDSEHWTAFLYYLYVLTLWMYLLRNLALVSYDMAMFARKIDRHAKDKQIDNLLLISNIATRGSFVQFFYASIFRNPKLSTVCKVADQTRPLAHLQHLQDPLFVTSRTRSQGSASNQEVLIAWEPYIR
ncbi:uncharacterized protein LOC110068201 [Orbicella faveolata]|uniref:uncharacterized protein LOC110068201 n=1 Tax=Orbicella faveolata TaxID=48498 RepID=UPI0009E28F83|nr:uncharacterized protein LOC110068201 [Orbicella faveolata]